MTFFSGEVGEWLLSNFSDHLGNEANALKRQCLPITPALEVSILIIRFVNGLYLALWTFISEVDALIPILSLVFVFGSLPFYEEEEGSNWSSQCVHCPGAGQWLPRAPHC